MTCTPLWQIAAEVSAPLAKTDEIVMIGSNDCITNGVTKLVSELPPTVQALTGMDLNKVGQKVGNAVHGALYMVAYFPQGRLFPTELIPTQTDAFCSCQMGQNVG